MNAHWGKLIQIDHPERDKTLKIDKLYESMYWITPMSQDFLDRIRIENQDT